jgi:hypothetical protein
LWEPAEGNWTGRYMSRRPGLHVITHELDKLHGTARGIKSSKSYLLFSERLDDLTTKRQDFTAPLGHAIELVPFVDPVRDVSAGRELRVRLVFNGQPLPNARVSFIPRGKALGPGFDNVYERMTDKNGEARFTPSEGDLYLIAARHVRADQKGEGYEQTQYKAEMSSAMKFEKHASFPQANTSLLPSQWFWKMTMREWAYAQLDVTDSAAIPVSFKGASNNMGVIHDVTSKGSPNKVTIKFYAYAPGSAYVFLHDPADPDPFAAAEKLVMQVEVVTRRSGSEGDISLTKLQGVTAVVNAPDTIAYEMNRAR